MRFSPRHVAVFALWLAATPVAPGKTGGPPSINAVLAGHGYRRVPLEASDSNLFVRVRINGRPAALVIDTGAQFTTLDRNTVAAWRLDEAPTGMNLKSPIGQSKEQIGLSRLMTIEVANIILSNDSVTVVDLGRLNRGARVHVAGVFGLSQLRKLGATIDCAQPALYLNPHGASQPAGSKLDKFLTGRNFVRVPIRVNEQGMPVVDCRINGLRSEIVVEIAAFTTIVEKKVARQAGVRLVDTALTGAGVGQLSAPISSGVGKDFSVGEFHTRNQSLSAADFTFSVLGIDYLRAHRAVIDCGGMNLFLKH